MGVNEFLDDSPISFDVSTTLEKNATTLFYFGRTRRAGINATTILRGLVLLVGVSQGQGVSMIHVDTEGGGGVNRH